MIFYEHVKSRDLISSRVQGMSTFDEATSSMQNRGNSCFSTDFYNIVWPYALRGCCLNRDTARTFREAGEWAKVDIQLSAAEDAWLAIPHISGRLTKAS